MLYVLCLCTIYVLYYVCMLGIYLCMCTLYRYYIYYVYVCYICPSIHPSIHLSVCPSTCLSNHPSVLLSMCTLYVYYVCILCMNLGIVLCIYVMYVYSVCTLWVVCILLYPFVCLFHSGERYKGPPFFLIPSFFRNMQPPSWHPSRRNIRPYDDTPESEKLKTINIKSWKSITYRNFVS